MYIVYAIFNKKHNKIYIGQTENMDERLLAHNEGRFTGSYTAKFDGCWGLLYAEKCLTRKDVLKREKQLKSYRGREFIRSLIKDI